MNERKAAGGRLGAWLAPGGVAFRLWGTRAARAAVAIYDARGERAEREVPLEARGGGHFEALVPGLGPGALYKFRLDGETYPDPYARALPFGVHGPAAVVDPDAYRWRHGPRREPLSGRTVVYELHVGTFTREGTFAAARGRLGDLAALGVTAVELMPLSSFAGRRGWGYDGVGHFAPHAAYGTPDELKAFVDEAHGLGLSVWLDVVYNHFGPEGNYLGAYSPEYFTKRVPTPWGDGPDFVEPHMRRFVLDNARHWLEEFRLDGLRLDATHHVNDPGPEHLLRELAALARALPGPPVLVAEDERNEPKLLLEYGLDGVWADDFHHVVHVLLTGERDGYYAGYEPRAADLARAVERGWLYEGQPWPLSGEPRGAPAAGLEAHRLVYTLQNHDQVGNRARGDRLNHLVSPAAYRGASALLLFLPMTPLLFMGQEWAASTPFQYFTDFPEELGRQVSAGRRREFEGFADFALGGGPSAVPDPQAETTFAASVLDWAERDAPGHREVLALYTDLLRLRRTDPVLGDASRARLRAGAEGGLFWAWRWGRDGGHRALVWNLTGSAVGPGALPLPEGYAWTELLRSERTEAGGPLAPYGAAIFAAEGPAPAPARR